MSKIRKTYNVEVSYVVNVVLDYENDVMDISENEEEYWKKKIFERFQNIPELSIGIMDAKFKMDDRDYLIWNNE